MLTYRAVVLRGLNQYAWHLGSYYQTLDDKMKGGYELHG